MDAEIQPLPTPDFQAMAQHYDNMSISCQGIAENIRLFQGMQQLQVLEQLNTITEILRDMQRQLREIRSESHIRDENNQARLQNSHIASINPQDPLEPLLSLETGEAIDGFPATAALISSMDAVTCTRVLQHLRKGTGGNLGQKRNKVRVAIGVYVTPTYSR